MAITGVVSRLLEGGAVEAWEVVASSDQVRPWFYWYEWGRLAGVTQSGRRVVSVPAGVTLALEVFDEDTSQPVPGHAPMVTIEWGPVAGAEGYVVLDDTGSSPVVVARFQPGEPWYRWVSAPLEDGAAYAYTVHAVHGVEILGMAGEVSGTMVRNPGPPVLSEVGYDGDDLTGEVDGSPFTAAALGLTEGVWHIVAVNLNAYGLPSGLSNVVLLAVDALGEAIGTPPRGADAAAVRSEGGGTCLVEAVYAPDEEGATLEAVSAARANKWLVYVSSDGTDPLLGSPNVVAMDWDGTGEARLPEALSWSTASFLDGATVRVAVKTRRDDGVNPAVDSETAVTAEVVHRAEGLPPARPRGALGGFGTERDYLGVPAGQTTLVIDGSKGLEWRYEPGRTALWANSVLVLALIWRGAGDARNGVYIPTGFEVNVSSYSAVASSAAAMVGTGTWDGSNKEVLIQAGGTVYARFDVQTMVCTLNAGLVQGAGAMDFTGSNVARARSEESVARVFEQQLEARRALLVAGDDGVVRFGGAVHFDLDQSGVLAV